MYRKEIVKLGGIISPLQLGEKTQFNMSTTLDYANSYDFKIVILPFCNRNVF